MTIRKLATALGATALLLAGPALAEKHGTHNEVGNLSCDVGDGSGFVFGSSKELTCTFNPVQDGAAEEVYVGVINRYGIDIGQTQDGKMSWLVLAPTDGSQIGAGALEGSYAGVGAEATVGVGLGANAMIGGSDESIALQPISLSTADGVNFAIGIAEIRLTKAGG